MNIYGKVTSPVTEDPKHLTINLPAARVIPLLISHHFDDLLNYMHTDTNVWFERPNKVIVNTEVYTDEWLKIKTLVKTSLDEKAVIDIAKNRATKLISKLVKKYKVIPEELKIEYRTEMIKKYDFSNRNWLKLDVSELEKDVK